MLVEALGKNESNKSILQAEIQLIDDSDERIDVSKLSIKSYIKPFSSFQKS